LQTRVEKKGTMLASVALRCLRAHEKDAEGEAYTIAASEDICARCTELNKDYVLVCHRLGTAGESLANSWLAISTLQSLASRIVESKSAGDDFTETQETAKKVLSRDVSSRPRGPRSTVQYIEAKSGDGNTGR
jgi:hypothetical protein